MECPRRTLVEQSPDPHFGIIDRGDKLTRRKVNRFEEKPVKTRSMQRKSWRLDPSQSWEVKGKGRGSQTKRRRWKPRKNPLRPKRAGFTGGGGHFLTVLKKTWAPDVGKT